MSGIHVVVVVVVVVVVAAAAAAAAAAMYEFDLPRSSACDNVPVKWYWICCWRCSKVVVAESLLLLLLVKAAVTTGMVSAS